MGSRQAAPVKGGHSAHSRTVFPFGPSVNLVRQDRCGVITHFCSRQEGSPGRLTRQPESARPPLGGVPVPQWRGAPEHLPDSLAGCVPHWCNGGGGSRPGNQDFGRHDLPLCCWLRAEAVCLHSAGPQGSVP